MSFTFKIYKVCLVSLESAAAEYIRIPDQLFFTAGLSFYHWKSIPGSNGGKISDPKLKLTWGWLLLLKNLLNCFGKAPLKSSKIL